MGIDQHVSEILSAVKVAELTATARDGSIDTKPIYSRWQPGDEQFFMTSPVAYARKILNIRRDGRVSVFCSDFTGTRLTDPKAVLIQGTAQAPEAVALPQDIPEYWQELFRSNPQLAEQSKSDQHRQAMDWYYWRLPVIVTPEQVHVFDAAPDGGTLYPPAPAGAPLGEQIQDALTRYPTAVFSGRDGTGYPYSVRATVAESDGDTLRVSPLGPFAGQEGPASLLWHRHDGNAGGMCSLQLVGSATAGDGDWTFVSEGTLGNTLTAMSYPEWMADGRAKSLRYLNKLGLDVPIVDWDILLA